MENFTVRYPDSSVEILGITQTDVWELGFEPINADDCTTALDIHGYDIVKKAVAHHNRWCSKMDRILGILHEDTEDSED